MLPVGTFANPLPLANAATDISSKWKENSRNHSLSKKLLPHNGIERLEIHVLKNNEHGKRLVFTR